MERDNTIVIYPKDKDFIWPEQEDKDITVIVDEGITREQKERRGHYHGGREYPARAT